MSTHSHHAYVMQAERTSDFLEVLGRHGDFSIIGNPDVTIVNVESLSIDNARDIKDRALLIPRSGKNVVIIAADFISEITQNALLKVCEEPPQQTVIYIVVPNVGVLLPTLRSRLHTIKTDSGATTPTEILAKKILKASLAERLELISPLHDNDEDENKKGEALHLLNALQEVLQTKEFRPKDNAEYARIMNLFEQTRADLHQTGAMMKMLMEALVLTI